jgi:penicillin amidase
MGWYDFSKNPQTINPERGFIFSTNNSPEDVDGVHYPGYYYAGNTRAASIIAALSTDKSDWTMEDSQELQMSTHSPVYERNCKMMCAYASENNFEGVYAEYFDKMKAWSGTHEMEEVEPTIYYRWMHAVIKDVFKDELGEEKYLTFRGTIVCENTFPLVLQNSDSPWWDDQNTDEIESARQIVNSAFRTAMDEIIEDRGDDPSAWKYGEIHHLTHKHAMGEVEILDDLFNVGRYEVPSAKDALCKYEFKLTDTVDFEVFSGPAMRVSVDFGDVNASESILPTGQSGNVFSPYYDNQADMYHSGEFRKQRMDTEEIEGVKIGESFIRVQ